MKWLVCGGRTYNRAAVVFNKLDELHAATPCTLLIHGAARGADNLAAQWAKARGVPVQAFHAEWHRFGAVAGRIRNKRMLDEKPDVVIAFPGGGGTEHMKTIARRAGVRVVPGELTGRAGFA